MTEWQVIISAGSIDHIGVSVSLQFWYNSIRDEQEYQVISESFESYCIIYHGTSIEMAKYHFKKIIDEIILHWEGV